MTASHGVLPTQCCGLLDTRRLMKLGFQNFGGLLTQRLFNEATGITTVGPGVAFGFHAGSTIGSEQDFDGLQVAPPI